MINYPSDAELRQLQSFKDGLCISIYIHYTQPTVSTTNPNAIELKKLINNTESALRVAAVRLADINNILVPARSLLDGNEFRTDKHASLAVFIRSDMFTFYRLPPDADFPTSLTISQGFELAPMIQTINNNPSFFVLVLGQNNVRLLEGDKYKLQPVTLRKFPTNLNHTLQLDWTPETTSSHSISAGNTGKGPEAYYGQYNANQVNKNQILEFFRRIDARLRDFLRDKSEPLILAGVSYIVPAYKRINSYPYLSLNSIKGNLEHSSLDEIRHKAVQTLGLTPAQST